MLTRQHPAPERDAAKGDRAPAAQWRQLVEAPPVVLPNPRVAPKEILGKLPGPEGVDAALMVGDRCLPAVCRAPGLESSLSRPAHVVPGERLEPVRVLVAPNVPEPPPDDRLGVDLSYDGTGSSAGSSAGAGVGTGSSSGAISISCSVSGEPISIETEATERGGRLLDAVPRIVR
jgi:hypothetical protein